MQIFTLIKMRRGWDMIELLTKRRSIRKYKDKAVEKEKVDMLIKAALLSPSAKNLRDWQFVVVDDRQVLQRLSAVRAASSAFLAAASLGIVVLGEADRNDVWVEDASIAACIMPSGSIMNLPLILVPDSSSYTPYSFPISPFWSDSIG
jgi:nitroreductase